MVASTNKRSRSSSRTAAAADRVDSAAAQTAARHRDHPAVELLSWFSDLGDQPQLRLLSAAVILSGVVTGNRRLSRAGARMLLAHEVTTNAKNFVKRRIDRPRPRSSSNAGSRKPRPGRHTSKEMTSFPSGHSAGAVAVARAFSRDYPEHAPAALALAGLVAGAQIPRCAHYPTDVGGGLLLGLAAEAASSIVWRRLD